MSHRLTASDLAGQTKVESWPGLWVSCSCFGIVFGLWWVHPSPPKEQSPKSWHCSDLDVAASWSSKLLPQCSTLTQVSWNAVHSMCCIQRHICLNLATAQSLMPMQGPNQKAEANMQNLSVSNQMGMSEGFSTLSYGPSKLCFLPLCSTRWSHENKTKQKKIKQNKNKQTDRQTNKQSKQGNKTQRKTRWHSTTHYRHQITTHTITFSPLHTWLESNLNVQNRACCIYPRIKCSFNYMTGFNGVWDLCPKLSNTIALWYVSPCLPRGSPMCSASVLVAWNQNSL